VWALPTGGAKEIRTPDLLTARNVNSFMLTIGSYKNEPNYKDYLVLHTVLFTGISSCLLPLFGACSGINSGKIGRLHLGIDRKKLLWELD
jgi:hypothetical protein